MTETETAVVTGWSGDSDYFTFVELDEFQPERVVDVLRGRIAGVIFRGMVRRSACDAIAERFWHSSQLRERGSEELNYYLGTYHYHKTTAQYLDESAAVADELDHVLDVPGEPLGPFRRGVSDALGPHATFRPAEHNGRPACQALLRSWRGSGRFALQPHDDLAQCGEPRQADFEIQRVRGFQPAALNICLENGAGGRLDYWNIKPDEASKRTLGLHYTGWPYPLESLAGYEMARIEINQGDVYVFNGGHVHAVEPNTGADVRRTTLAGLFGFVDDRTAVFWT
jgi:hypothetical protein